MDLRVLITSLITIFLAEVGDKTQLAVLAGTSATKKPLEIFIGASLGLILATAVGVLIGQVLGDNLPEKLIRMVGGSLFILIGFFLIWKGL